MQAKLELVSLQLEDIQTSGEAAVGVGKLDPF